jgi:hypothetical protein
LNTIHAIQQELTNGTEATTLLDTHAASLTDHEARLTATENNTTANAAAVTNEAAAGDATNATAIANEETARDAAITAAVSNEALLREQADAAAKVNPIFTGSTTVTLTSATDYFYLGDFWRVALGSELKPSLIFEYKEGETWRQGVPLVRPQ